MLTHPDRPWHDLGMVKGAATPAQRSTQVDVVEAWLAQQATSNTRTAYRSDLGAFGRWCVQRGAVPLDVDVATLGAFMAARRQAGDSASTLRRRWSSLASFFRFAVEASAIEGNPLAGAAWAGTPAAALSPTAVLTAASVDAYLATAAALDPRLEALVALLVFDGLKLGEALALDVDDVTGRPPKVSLVLRRKGEQQRVELTEATARAVRRCAGRRRGQPLFISARSGVPPSSSQRLTRFGADHLIRQLSAPGDERVTANALRRYHFTANRDAGVDAEQVRRRAGLADVRGLRRYSSDTSERTAGAEGRADSSQNRSRTRTSAIPSNTRDDQEVQP
ncbi:MAG: integrase family protein [Ilumatobacteraceae bacterium]|nr:integrase family protein [Ilumatobacteraceae bacterium]